MLLKPCLRWIHTLLSTEFTLCTVVSGMVTIPRCKSNNYQILRYDASAGPLLDMPGWDRVMISLIKKKGSCHVQNI